MPTQSPTRRLTEEQRELATTHAYLIDLLADRMRSSKVDRDERRSAAAWGLVKAARTYKPGSSVFATYAGVAMEREIARAHRPVKRRPITLISPDILAEMMCSPDRNDVDTCDESDHYRRRFDRLSPRERDTLEQYMAGERWSDIARSRGAHRQSVEVFRRKAAEKLRA
jgi:DNA-binding NarL/FixJ family response regulator